MKLSAGQWVLLVLVGVVALVVAWWLVNVALSVLAFFVKVLLTVVVALVIVGLVFWLFRRRSA